MTVAIAWIRKIRDCNELIFISDSRLVGGQRWDQCPKMIEMPGNNSVIAFAGDTDFAYPMMIQMKHAMSGYRRIETRAMDIVDINGHLLNHANHLLSAVYDSADPNYVPNIEFIFGGYSWIEKKYKLWKYYFKKSDNILVKDGKEHRILPNVEGNIVVIGDQREKFKKELRRILTEKYKDMLNEDNCPSLDMEPFEALCNILRDSPKEETIGGAPQMIKVYQYMNTQPIGVYWPEKIDTFSNRTLLGRKMLAFEDTSYWFIDPKTLVTNPCYKNNNSEE